jgi:hypothetical protein
MVRITQVPESPSSLSISVDLNFPRNGVPHWMTETLVGSALMKEASKCSETLQEYRSGYENGRIFRLISQVDLPRSEFY